MKLRSCAVLLSVGVVTVAASTSAQQKPSSAPAPQAQSPAPAQGNQAPVAQTPDTTFSVDVAAMTISVTVVDDKGKSVNNLTQDDFVLLEDGQQRPITGFRAVNEKTENRVPVGLGLVLDASGSMSQDRLDAMRTAVEFLVNKRLSKEDEVYFVEFAASPRMVVPWTSNKTEVLNLVRRIKTRDGTAIYDAIAASLPVSKQGKAKKQVMLVITDGADTNSKTNRQQLVDLARSSEVVIYALVAEDEERVGSRGSSGQIRQQALELAQVTDVTGGRTKHVRGFQELENAITDFGKDFTTQYEISFERTGGKDGKFHPIRVGVRRQNITVRHRVGYIAN